MLFKQSESTAARRRVYLHLVDQTDGITPETGEAGGQPQISKNGASFSNTSATLTAVGNGLYYVELTTGELDTFGAIAVRYDSANTAEAQVLAQVVAFDPFDSAGLGLSRMDAAITTRSSLSSSDIETAVGNELDSAIPGSPTADSINERLKTLDENYTSTRAGYLDNLDAAVTTRATPAQVYTEVSGVIKTDTGGEPAAGAPPETASLLTKVDWLYAAWRNKFTSTSAERRLFKDDESTTMTKSTISESGGTYTRGEFVAP